MAIDPIEAISPLAGSVEKARVGIGVLSGDDRWLDANQRLCELLGYSREELLNLERVDTTHPGDVDAEWLELERVRKGETGSTQLEERYQLKNGNSLWVSVTAARTRADDPGATELLVVVQDLTTRRESQRGLSVQHLVSQIIAEAKSPPETLQTVLAEVGRTLRWSYATYWALDHTANVLRPVRTWMPSDRVFVEFDRKTKGIVFGRGEGFPGRVLESQLRRIALRFWNTCPDRGPILRGPRVLCRGCPSSRSGAAKRGARRRLPARRIPGTCSGKGGRARKRGAKSFDPRYGSRFDHHQ